MHSNSNILIGQFIGGVPVTLYLDGGNLNLQTIISVEHHVRLTKLQYRILTPKPHLPPPHARPPILVLLHQQRITLLLTSPGSFSLLAMVEAFLSHINPHCSRPLTLQYWT